jgi:hypothetical protein
MLEVMLQLVLKFRVSLRLFVQLRQFIQGMGQRFRNIAPTIFTKQPTVSWLSVVAAFVKPRHV